MVCEQSAFAAECEFTEMGTGWPTRFSAENDSRSLLVVSALAVVREITALFANPQATTGGETEAKGSKTNQVRMHLRKGHQ